VLALILADLAGAASLTIAAPPTEACRIRGVRTEVRCGQIERLLDPGRPGGPRIAVHFVVIPAVSRSRRPDPLFLLAGGPGQSAIDIAGDTLPLLARLHNRRDLVYVDQRGTGRSAPLQCPQPAKRSIDEAVDADTQVREMLQCLMALEKLPYIQRPSDLGLFTTTLAVQDLDAVRQALGAAQINLLGASYGTRVALEYQRQFPANLRRTVLDGVAPPDMVLPYSASPDNQAALDALWASCAAQSACRAAFPHLAADWAALKASLPRIVTVADPLTGEPERVTMTSAGLMAALRAPLYSPVLASALPQAVSNAAQGRFDALLALSGYLASRGSLQVAEGMHFSVICAEDAPRMAAGHEAPGAEFGELFAVVYQRVCAQWPRGAVPAGFYSLPRATRPVLLLSGGLDPMTPPRHALRVAGALGAMAHSIVVPNAGHGVMGLPCISDVLYRFFDAADDEAALRVDAGCAQSIPRPLAIVAPQVAAP
jgi:pimeloyl-ACP methyl ester carboxylesterase